MLVKTVPVRIKAAGTNEGTDEGVFEAIVAAYNLDSVGDRIIPGAFAKTLADWAQSGDPIPVYWSHRMDDPDYNIGTVLDARETDGGLWVRAQLDMESPKAAQVYRLLKGRRVTQFSFAYDIEDGAWVEPQDGQPYYELRTLKLHEVGPTPIGANQETELLTVKNGHQLAAVAAQLVTAKAGRTLSAKNEERVAEIARLAKELLDSLNSADGESTNTDAAPAKDGASTTSTTSTAERVEDQATPAQPATAEEPAGAKADVSARPGPASLRLLADLGALCAEAF